MEKVASVGLRVPASILEHFRLPDADGDDAVPAHNIGQALERYAADIATPLGPIARSIDVPMKSDPGADPVFFSVPFCTLVRYFGSCVVSAHPSRSSLQSIAQTVFWIWWFGHVET